MQHLFRILAMLCALVNAGNAQVFWQSDFGPWGGRVYDLCEDGDGSLYAASAQGLYFSDNEGASWRLLALEGQELRSVHRASSGTLLVSTDERILRSADNGRTWCDTIPLNRIIEHGYPARIDAFFEHSSGALFFGQGISTWISIDDGRSWEEFSKSVWDRTVDRWSETEDGRLLAGNNQYMLPDRVPVRVSTVLVHGERTAITCMLATGNRRRIAWGYDKGWLISWDDGGTWEIALSQDRHDDLLMISVSPGGVVLARHQEDDFVYSNDGGEHWDRVAPLPEGTTYVYDLLCTLHGSMFIATSQFGVLKFDAAVNQWLAYVEHMQFAETGPILQRKDGVVAATLPVNQEMRMMQEVGTWRTEGRFESPVSDIAENQQGELLAATDGHGVLISMDGGGTWNPTTGGEPTVNALLQLRDGRMLAGGQTGLYESRDDGKNWTRLRSTNEWSIECLLERGNGEIILGGEAGIFIASHDLQSWRAARPSWTPVMRLAEDGSGRLFAGTVGEGLFRSTDGGSTWETAGFEGQWITGIVTVGASYCFVATRQEGIFESRDGGSSWNPYSEGLRSNEILDLVPGVDGYLYAGTVRGLSRSAWPVLSGGYLTPDFTLEQNTPNPASNTAVFAWSIPREGNVRMSVYDLLGREIAVVLDDVQAVPGIHWQQLDTGAMAQGTYFCVMRFEGQTLDRKFQVVR